MGLIDWTAGIARARSPEELLEYTREYLASWYHMDLAQIDDAYRPTRLRAIDDIPYWSERLAEGYCEGAVHRDRGDLHRDMLAFFMAANQQLTVLRRKERAAREGPLNETEHEADEVSADDGRAGRASRERRGRGPSR